MTYGNTWPQPPNPYDPNMRVKLVPQMRNLRFELLRSQLYPKFEDVTVAALEAQQSEGFDPAFMFTSSSGYRKHPVNAAEAVSKSRQKLRELRDAALTAIGAPPVPPPPSPPVTTLPRADAHMYPHPPPGYNVREVPFYPKSTLPSEAQAVQEDLRQQPGVFSDGSPAIVPSAVARAMQRATSRIFEDHG